MVAGGASSNRHRRNANLVSAVFCAGLYPHLAVAQLSPGSTKAAPLVFCCGRRGAGTGGSGGASGDGTSAAEASSGGGGAGGGAGSGTAAEGSERVVLHRDSVNFGARTMTTRYMIYVEKRAGAHQGHLASLMHTAAVTPAAVLMFGNSGDLVVRHHESKVVVDGWLTVHVSPKVAILVRDLRRAVGQVLMDLVERRGQRSNGPGRQLRTASNSLGSQDVRAVGGVERADEADGVDGADEGDDSGRDAWNRRVVDIVAKMLAEEECRAVPEAPGTAPGGTAGAGAGASKTKGSATSGDVQLPISRG